MFNLMILHAVIIARAIHQTVRCYYSTQKVTAICTKVLQEGI
jgi:hypothetical protein